jgi:hypothetical protein
MKHLLQDPIFLLWAISLLLTVIAILTLVSLYKTIKRLSNLEFHVSNTNQSMSLDIDKMYETFNKELKKVESDCRAFTRGERFTLDKQLDDIKLFLYQPLYQVGNIVDFLDLDSGETVTGKIIGLANPSRLEEPKYNVEIEYGIIYTIYQSQITAWTN